MLGQGLPRSWGKACLADGRLRTRAGALRGQRACACLHDPPRESQVLHTRRTSAGGIGIATGQGAAETREAAAGSSAGTTGAQVDAWAPSDGQPSRSASVGAAAAATIASEQAAASSSARSRSHSSDGLRRRQLRLRSSAASGGRTSAASGRSRSSGGPRQQQLLRSSGSSGVRNRVELALLLAVPVGAPAALGVASAALWGIVRDIVWR